MVSNRHGQGDGGGGVGARWSRCGLVIVTPEGEQGGGPQGGGLGRGRGDDRRARRLPADDRPAAGGGTEVVWRRGASVVECGRRTGGFKGTRAHSSAPAPGYPRPCAPQPGGPPGRDSPAPLRGAPTRFCGTRSVSNLRAIEGTLHSARRFASREDGIRAVADSVASPNTWRGRAAAVGVPSKPGRSGGGAEARRALWWPVAGRRVATLPVGGPPRGATRTRRCAVCPWHGARVDTLLTLANPPFTAVLAQMDDGGAVHSACPTVQRGPRDRRALVSRSCCEREVGKRGTRVPRPQPRGRGETRA